MDIPPLIALAGSIGVVGGVAVGGLAGVRVQIQRNADIYRRRYLASIPPGRSFESIGNLLESLGGISGAGKSHLMGMPSICFETVSDSDGIRNYITTPGSKEQAGYVVKQFRATLGASLTFANTEDYAPWDDVIELKLTSNSTPIQITNPTAVVERVLTAMSSVGDGEAKLLQWVVTSLSPPQHQGDDKFADLPIFTGVGRIAARAETRKDARKLILEVFEALRSLRAYGVAFQWRPIHSSLLLDRTYRRASVLRPYCTFSKTEMGAVIGFRCGEMAIPGMSQGRARNLPVDPKIPEGPFTFGMSDFPGNERSVGISPLDRMMHQYIIGPSGSGKSSLIENQVLQDWEQGFGNTVIDPHGDLIWNILDVVPMERVKDVIVVDLTDTSMPIGLNVLEGENHYLTTQNMMGIAEGTWPGVSSLARTADIMRAGFLTLAMQGLTLMDLSLLIDSSERGKDFRAWVTKGLKGDPVLRQFWHEFDSMPARQQIEFTGPVMRRLRQIELWPSLRAMLGQTKSSFSFEDAMANNKIILVSLNRRLIGSETARFVGSTVVNRIWEAAQARSSMAAKDRKPYFCYIDEAHNFLRMPVNLTDVLAEARKYGLGFILAHQDLSQLLPIQRDAIMSNARTKVIFQPAANDASFLARELSPYYQAQDLQNLDAFQAVVRVVCNSQVAPPTTVQTFPPPRGQGIAPRVREASRRAHGRPIRDVERELADRQQPFREPPRKPNVGREEPENDA